MKALVTGGAGFIGSHIVERLLKDGHSVVVLDNFSSGKPENLSFVSRYSPTANRWTLIKGDIRDYPTCLKACEGVEVVFHQAALRSVPKSMNNPYEYNEVNITGTLNMLKAATNSGTVKRFVFASSSSIYGDTSQFPEKETALPLLISPYALTKLAGEYYCRIFSENFGLETVSLRYFNVYGPRQALDDEYAVVIPKFIYCILNNEPPPIFGNGRQSRDFTYIDNVVEANILAATVPLTPQRHNATAPADTSDSSHNTQYTIHNRNVFNVANGETHTVLELVDLLNKIMGKNIKPKFLPPRPGDVFKTLADISQARAYLTYQPKMGFEQGLKKTVEWFRLASSPQCLVADSV